MKIYKEDNLEMFLLILRQIFSLPCAKDCLKNLIKSYLGYRNQNIFFQWINQTLKDFFLKKETLDKKFLKRKKKIKILKLILNYNDNKIDLQKEKFYPIWKILDLRQEFFWGKVLMKKKRKGLTYSENRQTHLYLKYRKSFFENLKYLKKKKKSFLGLKKTILLSTIGASFKFF